MASIIPRTVYTEPPTQPAPTTTTYTVKSGDTLGAIAAAHGLSLSELLGLPGNEGFQSNPNLIFPGQTVVGSYSAESTSYFPPIELEPLPTVSLFVPGDGSQIESAPASGSGSDDRVYLDPNPPPWRGTAAESFWENYAATHGMTAALADYRAFTASGGFSSEPSPYASNLISGTLGDPNSVILPGLGAAGFGAPFTYGSPNPGDPFTYGGGNQGFLDDLSSAVGDFAGGLGDALGEFGGGLGDFAGGTGDFLGDVGGGITGILDAIPMTAWLLIVALAAVLIVGFNSGGVRASPAGRLADFGRDFEVSK